MQIIIEIDTVDYEYIKNGYIIPIKIDNHIYDAIRKGTALPKGHGRLIDADKLKQKWLFGRPEKVEIDIAPTVIEADKEDN